MEFDSQTEQRIYAAATRERRSRRPSPTRHASSQSVGNPPVLTGSTLSKILCFPSDRNSEDCVNAMELFTKSKKNLTEKLGLEQGSSFDGF
jgi:hypothetical protein